MSQVGELAQKWRQTANLIDDAEIPWGSIRGLSDQTWCLGTELLETRSTSLTDLAIKVRWLIEQDFDAETLKESLRCILIDIRLLEG